MMGSQETTILTMLTGDVTVAEKIEQSMARTKTYLPKKMDPSREAFEKVGFSFRDIDDDDVLVEATLPAGWTMRDEGLYWTYFSDEKGRERGSSFYKGAIWDRNGHMYLRNRFYINNVDLFPDKMDCYLIEVQVQNSDGTVLFRAGQCESPYCAEYRTLKKKAEQWLHEHYPEYEDPTAYWEQEQKKEKKEEKNE